MVAVVVSALPYKCPGAPHEGAMLIADTLRKRGLGKKNEVHLFSPEPQPMPVAGPTLGEAVKQMLTDRGVSFHPLHKLTRVDPDARELTFDGKDPLKYDLMVAIPPHCGPKIARQAGLTNEAGWIPVDRAPARPKHENVFALGDVTAISIPGRWKPDVAMMLPKAGVFEHTITIPSELILFSCSCNGSRDTARDHLSLGMRKDTCLWEHHGYIWFPATGGRERSYVSPGQ